MTEKSFWIRYIIMLKDNSIFWLLMAAIATDMLFGALRAWKYHKWNSAVGLDGFIRKIGIVSCIMVLHAIDIMLQADIFQFLPTEAQNVLGAIGLVNGGFMEFFGVIDIMYECTSILKNMVILGIPIPKGLREKIAHWLENMTDETNVDLIGAEHKFPDLILDKDQLVSLGLENLKKMADNWGLEYPDDITAGELADIIVAEPVTLS